MKRHPKSPSYHLAMMRWCALGLALDGVAEAWMREPVWAIGSGVVAFVGFVWARVLAARTVRERYVKED